MSSKTLIISEHRCTVTRISGAWVAYCPVNDCPLAFDKHPHIGLVQSEVIEQANAHARFRGRLIKIDFDELLMREAA